MYLYNLSMKTHNKLNGGSRIIDCADRIEALLGTTIDKDKKEKICLIIKEYLAQKFTVAISKSASPESLFDLYNKIFEKKKIQVTRVTHAYFDNKYPSNDPYSVDSECVLCESIIRCSPIDPLYIVENDNHYCEDCFNDKKVEELTNEFQEIIIEND